MAYIIRPILDNIFVSKNVDSLYLLPILVICIYFFKGIGRYIQAYNTAYISENIIARLRLDTLRHIIYLDLKFFYTYSSGDIVSRFSNDLTNIRMFFADYIASSVKDIITIIVLLVVIISSNAEMAFYALVVMPTCIYPLSFLAKKIKGISHQNQHTIAKLISKMTEIINNYETIKSHIAEEIELKEFDKISLKVKDISIREEKTNALVSPIMEVISAIGIAFVIVAGGNYVIADEMSIGAFFSFVTALLMIYEPIKRTTQNYNKMHSMSASFERILELSKAKSDIIDGTKNIDKIKSIKFENVFLKYGKKNVLKNINIKINEGESIALIGGSGGGKTSFINLINRFLDSSDGSIYINDKDIKTLKQKSLRSKIALVSQRIFIFNDTIKHNICYSYDYNEEKLKNAISLANAEFIYDLKEGISTILDEFGTNLSGGQRQRIAIARAIYKDPDVYIFDEATSALDGKSENIIKESIKNISKNKIVLIIAHRLSSISYSDKIMIFNKGEIVDFGKSEDIRENSIAFKELSKYHQ